MCNHKFKKGKNKGTICNIKKCTDGFCKKHQPKKQKQILNAKQQKKNLQKKKLKLKLKKNGKQYKIFLNMKLLILEIVEIKKLKDI